MINFEKNVVLADKTTLRVGGSAKIFAIARTKDELIEMLDYAKDKSLEFVVIGGGSNVLVSDDGFDGLVIVNRANNIEINGTNVVAESGALLALVSKKSLDAELLGLEFGAGIPGTIGAAVAGNVGMVYGSISDVLTSVEVWDDGKIVFLDKDDLDLTYRNSNLRGSKKLILSAKFALEEGETKEVKEKIKADLARRVFSYKGHTAGSYFKNPGGVSAGELIDKAGLKGYRIGGAEVSTAHANVFRNAGGATAKDFFELEKYVKKIIKEKYNVDLESEVVKIGNFS